MTPPRAEDRSSWIRNGKHIHRGELLRLIEKSDGPAHLDLRGATFAADTLEELFMTGFDLSPGRLAPLAAQYREKHEGSEPPWLNSEGGVDLAEAQLQEAELSFAQLQRADLGGAQLQGAHLGSAKLHGANVGRAELQRANLGGAQLQGAYLGGARLQGATLVDAELQGADLMDAQLQEAWLADTQLQGVDLRYAHLERVDMYGVTSLVGARWCRAFLDCTRMDRQHLGRSIGDENEARRCGSAGSEGKWEKAVAYSDARGAYLLLKNNFNQIGGYEDASWAYVKERQMEKMEHYWRWRAWGEREVRNGARKWRSWGWRVWLAWGTFWRWLRNWAYELATGYGERPWNPVAWGGVVVLGFAVGFTRAIGNFWDALVYSIATFATFNLARFNAGPQGRGFEVASSLEALLGIALLALVVFTLGNRMSRG